MINPQVLLQMLPQVKNNPIGAVIGAGLNIPQNQQFNSPYEIVQYLASTGQVNQNLINTGISQAQSMGYKL